MPPPGQEAKGSERKRGNFQSIGRLGLVRDDVQPDLAPVNKAGTMRFAFDPSEGRDYAADAESIRPASRESKDSARGKKDDYKPPVVKSPAEVAAEKAAEWKREEHEAENKRKEGKSFIKKK